MLLMPFSSSRRWRSGRDEDVTARRGHSPTLAARLSGLFKMPSSRRPGAHDTFSFILFAAPMLIACHEHAQQPSSCCPCAVARNFEEEVTGFRPHRRAGYSSAGAASELPAEAIALRTKVRGQVAPPPGSYRGERGRRPLRGGDGLIRRYEATPSRPTPPSRPAARARTPSMIL